MTGPAFTVKSRMVAAALTVVATLALSGCASAKRARTDATSFAPLEAEPVIDVTTASAESDRIVGEYPYDLEELVRLAGTAAGFTFEGFGANVPVQAPAPLALEVDIRERTYTRGVSRLQAVVASARLVSPTRQRHDGGEQETRPRAVAVYRADSTESIISYYHVYELLFELFEALYEEVWTEDSHAGAGSETRRQEEAD